MEPALRSFLDGVDADDSVVAIRPGAKNDNEEPLLDGSGMLDMREMAKRYREMVDSSIDKKVVEAVPLVDLTEVRGNVLAPIVETATSTRGTGLLVAMIACGSALLVGLTVIITVLVMRGNAGAELPAMAAAEPSQLAEFTPELLLLEEDAVAPSASEESATDEPAQLLAIEEEPAQEALATEAAPAAPEPAAPAIKTAARAQPNATSPVAAEPRSNSETATLVASAAPAQDSATSSPEAPLPPPPVVAKAEAPVLAADASCDEVSCLLEGRNCCDKPGKAAPEIDKAAVDRDRPESLSRADISAGLKSVQGRLHTCGSRHEVSGAVTIKLQITAEGAVTSAKVASGGEEFQTCVSDILRKARFAETQAGTTLSYPIILR